jgi:hypothetical protein
MREADRQVGADPAVVATYAHDGVGNRTEVTTAGALTGSYTMSDLPAKLDRPVHQYTATPTSLRCYDDNGNLTEIEPRSPFDLDGDGTIGDADFALFDACSTGPTVPVDASSGCARADFDHDGDLDVADFAEIQPYLWGMTWSPPVTAITYDYHNQMV